MFRVKIAGILAVSLLWACASAGDKLQEGIALEATGDAYAASLRYLDALEKDSSFEPARMRLASAGARALREGLEDAEVMADRGEPIVAARRLPRLEGLIDRAAAYGVRLDRPDDYLGRRIALIDGAADALEQFARSAERDEDWPAARGAWQELRTRMATTDARAHEAAQAEARVLRHWAEADLDAGFYKAAFGHAEEALALSPSPEIARVARSIQEEAVDLGTVHVAVLPTRLSPAVTSAERIAPEFTRALDDALELDHWVGSPLFVEVVPPPVTRRALRTGGVPRGGDLDGPGLRLLLSDLAANVVAIVEVTDIVPSKSNVDTDVVEIPLEGGGVASTRLEKGRLQYTVRADVELIDERGRQIRRTSVSASASERYELGIYEGDVRALLLNRRQREHFDPDFIAAQRLAIQEAAAVELADDVARRVFDGTLGYASKIPHEGAGASATQKVRKLHEKAVAQHVFVAEVVSIRAVHQAAVAQKEDRPRRWFIGQECLCLEVAAVPWALKHSTHEKRLPRHGVLERRALLQVVLPDHPSEHRAPELILHADPRQVDRAEFRIVSAAPQPGPGMAQVDVQRIARTQLNTR